VTPFLGELVGTALLILMGDGVVAAVLLNRSKAQNAGWIVITAGWSVAVFVGVFAVAAFSGAHLNPAVTAGLAAAGKFPADPAAGGVAAQVAGYVAAQMLGAFLGAVLVWLTYLPHWPVTSDPDAKLAVFCTAPAIRNPLANLVTEVIGTAVLLFGVMAIINPKIEAAAGDPEPSLRMNAGYLGALPVALLVLGIGLSLGGPTGYAINPARDLGPRVAHALLPIPGKRDSDWGYAWIPVIGPLVGGVLGALLFKALVTAPT
jgi:glycerol uptake facilitator protein